MKPEYPALPPVPLRGLLFLLLISAALMECLLWRYAAEQERLFATTGVRFAEVLSENTVQAVSDAQGDDEILQRIYASFWGQCTQDIAGENGRSVKDVICIGFYGEATDCLPVQYLHGSAPGSEGKTCAVSAELAESLFGSERVVGLRIRLQGQLYEIVGVFSAKDNVLLFPCMQNLSCAELRGISPDTPKADVEQWCVAAGLPAPQCIRCGPQRVCFAKAFCWIPFFLTGCMMLIALLRISVSWPPLVRNAFWFILALSLVLHFTAALYALPGWLVPARWSDFSFWQNLQEKIEQSHMAWETATRYWRDYGTY